MNITDLLSFLKEDIEINKLNSLIKDKVSPETISSLANKMKKGKYDNKAEAILKAAQQAKGEIKDYIEKNAGRIYAILKLIANNNPQFNASDIMSRFIFWTDMHENEDFDSFWKKKYQESRAGKYTAQKEPSYGIRNAKVKELPNAFIFFPRTTKTVGMFGINSDDFDKQYQDIKKLSAEMAAKDTSGEEGANDIQWCVASPGSRGGHYHHYKEKGGIFLIIVGKNKDGSPNYNKRYLYWICNDGSNEFADKLDYHVDIEDALDTNTLSWIEKFEEEYLKNNKNKLTEKKISDTLKKKVDIDASAYRKENKPSPNLKKIFKLFSERLENSAKQGYLKDAIDKIQKINDELAEQDDIISWFKKHGAKKHTASYATWYKIDNSPLALEIALINKHPTLVFDYIAERKSLFFPQVSAINFEKLKEKLKEAKEKGILKSYIKFSKDQDWGYYHGPWGDYSKEKYYLKSAKSDWNRGHAAPETSKTYKEAADVLKNNKKLLDVYKSFMKMKEDRNVQDLGSHFTLVSELNEKGERENKVFFYPRLRFLGGKLLGHVEDPDIIDKIKKAFDELDNPKPLFHDGSNHKEGELVRPKKKEEDVPF